MKTIKKVLIFILCIFAVIGAASIALYIHPSMMQQPETKSTESIKVTKLGFEDIGELATQSAYCTIVKEVDESKNSLKQLRFHLHSPNKSTVMITLSKPALIFLMLPMKSMIHTKPSMSTCRK